MPIRVEVPGHGVVEFPDGTPPDVMEQALAQFRAEQAPQPSERSSPLAAVGGLAGSLAGGKSTPAGMALAGAGGMAGQAVSELAGMATGRDQSRIDIAHKNRDALEGLRLLAGPPLRTLKAGAEQAGLEGAGRALSAVVKPVAQTIYGLAMRPNSPLRKEYGLVNLIKRGFEDKVMPNSMGETRAGRLMKESADEATAMAARDPNTVPVSRVTNRAAGDQATRAGRQMQTAGIAPPTNQIADQLARIEASNPQNVSMAQLLDIRRGADDIAAPAFKAAKGPGGAGRVPVGTEPSVAKSVSESANVVLRDVLGPAFTDVNKRTQQRFGVKQMAHEAAERPGVLTNLLAGGVGLGGLTTGKSPQDAMKEALIFKALFSPNVNAAASLLMPSLARQVPRGADVASQGALSEAVRRLLAGQE